MPGVRKESGWNRERSSLTHGRRCVRDFLCVHAWVVKCNHGHNMTGNLRL